MKREVSEEDWDFEIMEIKNELAISLQMTDQYSHNNVFLITSQVRVC